jgi:hypothetical protein
VRITIFVALQTKKEFQRRYRKAIHGRVEERRGIASASRFPSPLVKPDVRISRIRLSDWFRDRLTTLRLTADNDAVSALQVRRTLRPC